MTCRAYFTPSFLNSARTAANTSSGTGVVSFPCTDARISFRWLTRSYGLLVVVAMLISWSYVRLAVVPSMKFQHRPHSTHTFAASRRSNSRSELQLKHTSSESTPSAGSGCVVCSVGLSLPNSSL